MSESSPPGGRRRTIWPVDKSLNYGRRRVADHAAAVAPFTSVLDLGAGDGTDLAAARRASPDARQLGVEFDPAKQEALRALGVETMAVDLESEPLPLDDASIDLVISNQTLEHVKEVFWIFHELSRVLRVGGHLILGVPNLAAMHNRVLLAMGRQPSSIKTASAHVRGFTLPDLRDFFGRGFPGGLEIVDVQGSNFYPFPPSLAVPLSDRLPSLSWSLFLLVRKTRPYDREFLDYPVDAALETPFYIGRDEHGDRRMWDGVPEEQR